MVVPILLGPLALFALLLFLGRLTVLMVVGRDYRGPFTRRMSWATAGLMVLYLTLLLAFLALVM